MLLFILYIWTKADIKLIFYVIMFKEYSEVCPHYALPMYYLPTLYRRNKSMMYL